MNLCKKFLLFFILFGLSDLLSAQKIKESDIWSGTYVLSSLNKENSEVVDTLVITKTKDIDSKEVGARYKSDLARWTIVSKKDKDQEIAIVRRFLFDVENKRAGYQEFGWSNLHKEGKMNCIDGGHFFICQTQANTKVTFNKDESYFTKTGVFGIWLHYGIVELKKVESEKR